MKCCFGIVFGCYISSCNCFHKHDINNLIYTIIHIEKTFKAIQWKNCKKKYIYIYFKKKQESQNICKKKYRIFLDILLQNPKPKLMAFQ